MHCDDDVQEQIPLLHALPQPAVVQFAALPQFKHVPDAQICAPPNPTQSRSVRQSVQTLLRQMRRLALSPHSSSRAQVAPLAFLGRHVPFVPEQ